MQFKDKGTKIAIDDFGSGYSNYHTLSLCKLTISNRWFHYQISHNRYKNRGCCQTIVMFARTSNMKVIAEFVKDEAIDTVLREIGIDYAQGYYYGKPSRFTSRVAYHMTIF